MTPRFLLVALVACCAVRTLSAGEIYVSPSGDDTASGNTPNQPIATLAAAEAKVTATRSSAKAEPVTVILADGVYYLNGKTLELTGYQSGEPGKPVVWLATPGTHPVIHAGRSLGKLSWIADSERPGVWKTTLQEGPRFGQLYLDSVRLTLARYPNATPGKVPFGGAVTGGFSPERARRWSDLDGVFIHGLTNNHWGSVHYRVTGVDATTGKVSRKGGWQINRPAPVKECFVEGPLEELDAPGEWAYRAADRMLFLMPPDGKPPRVEGWSVDGADIAVALRGDAKHPAHDIEFRGITFTGTARTFMDTQEPLLLGDWCIARKAAVLLEGTERCVVADSTFTRIGGNAVIFSKYNRAGTVERCEISDTGAGGVNFVGSPDAVRDPRFKYGQPLNSVTADRTPGPKNDDYPKDCRVSDCWMHGLGVWEKQVAGVAISMSSGIVIEHNTIATVPRAAINVNDGTWGGHRIVGNDAWDSVRETHDHGTFNSWGRDRFWQLDGIWSGAKGAGLRLVKSFAKLDAVGTITLRGNRFDCRHGWGIDLDDGSTNYLIEDNLVTTGGIKLREGFFRTVRNNIVVGDTLHPHVWYHESGDSVTANIFGRVGYMNVDADIGKSGGIIDKNLFSGRPARQSLKIAHKSGSDKNSLFGDPKFIDPTRGDYRVTPDSPALRLGFVNFSMDFGTRVPAFAEKANAARAAYLIDHPIEVIAPTVTGELWGAKVSEIDDGLRSAGGLPDNDGLYLLAVPAGSPAAKLGLAERMVLRAIAGHHVTGLASALKASEALKPGEPFELSIQNPVTQTEQILRVTAP